MYLSSSIVVLLHTPQRLKTRELTLIGVLIRLARGEGLEVMIGFMMEACLQLQAEQAAKTGAADLQAPINPSFWHVVHAVF